MTGFFEELSAPYMNGACSVAKTVDDVTQLAATGAGAIVVGSITPLAREGNVEPRWYAGEGFALNAFGMPNDGKEFYVSALPDMVRIAHGANKKLILSVAGFSIEDYTSLAELVSTGIDMLELNLGCPNVRADGVQHPIVSFDRETMKELIEAVLAVTGDTPVSVKLSPYTNPGELVAVAQVLSSFPIAAVVTMNTFPNAFWTDNLQPVLKANGGFGGMSGSALLPFSLGQVKQFRANLPESIAVVGIGGVESPEDSAQMFKAGASAVQAATLIVRDGHSALDRIAA